MCKSKAGVLGWVAFTIAHVIACIILLVVAIKFVPFGHYGINYDRATGILYEPVVGTGRYLVGVSHSFITFPSLIQRIEYTDGELGWYTGDSIARQIQVRTTDGVAVIFYINFEYQLIQSELYALIQRFGSQYQNTMVEIATDLMTDVGSNFTSIDFYQRRTVVRQAMSDAIAVMLREMGSVLSFFMFGEVELPRQLESVLEDVRIVLVW